jgi:hypothetical protein
MEMMVSNTFYHVVILHSFTNRANSSSVQRLLSQYQSYTIFLELPQEKDLNLLAILVQDDYSSELNP